MIFISEFSIKIPYKIIGIFSSMSIINIENKEDNNNIEEDSDKTEDDPKNMELD